MSTILCRLEDLPDPGARGFELTMRGEPIDAFLVRRAGNVYGYVNRCPHTGAPLNWMPDVFLSLDGDHIQCATHDALFTIADGRCIAGPCPGSRLTALVFARISHRAALKVINSNVKKTT